MKKQKKGVSQNLPTEKDTNQTRKVSMFKKSSDFDRIDRINPFTQMSSNPSGGYGKKK